MSYTVKIVDNETGKVIEDRSDVVCIIGAFGRDSGVHQLTATCCSGFVLCQTLNNAEDAIRHAESKNPKIKPARLSMRLVDSIMGEDDDSDNEDS